MSTNTQRNTTTVSNSASSSYLSNTIKVILSYALTLLAFPFLGYVISYLTLLVGLKLSTLSFLMTFVATIITGIVIPNQLQFKTKFVIYNLVGLVLSIVLSFYLSRVFWDMSYDGMAYQGEAIARLSEGWNPIYQSAQGHNGLHSIWLQHYPKASWLNQASIFQFTNNWEDTKFYNFVLLLASVAISIVAVSRFQIAKIFQVMVVIVACFSPIVMLQSTGLLLDGQISSLLVIVFGLLAISYYNSSWLVISGLAMSIILTVNTKTAGMVYTLIALVVYGIILAINNHKHSGKILGSIMLFVIVGIGIFGFNPYITNTITKSNPIYPSLDKKAFDASENTPKNYLNKNSLEVFVAGMFFETNKDFEDKDGGAKLKIPFTVSTSEWKAMSIGAIKKGGFGPLFGGGILLTILVLAISVVVPKKPKSNTLETSDEDEIRPMQSWQIFSIVTASVVVSCLLTSTASTARYIPQLWIWLAIVLLYLFNLKSKSVNYMASGLFVVLLINIAITTIASTTQQSELTAKAQQILTKVKESDKILIIDFGRSTATRTRLQSLSIPFEEKNSDKKLDDKRPITDCKASGKFMFLPENESSACVKK